MAAFNKFNCFVADVANKVHNLGADTLKIMLTNSAPSASNTVKTDIAEITAQNGYSGGGVAVTGVTSTQTGGVYKLVASADPAVNATGAVGPFRYAVLYNSSASGGPLIGWWDYGTSISLANGETFTFDLNQTSGIIQNT